MNLSGQPLGQRDLDKDQRLVRQGGVKESETALIVRQPAAKVVPSLDFVHRFIGD